MLLTDYFKIILFFFIAAFVGLLLVTLSYIASKLRAKNIEKLSTYECGFEPFDNATRLPFDIHFYIVGVLFLIFDVEIALLFPWVLALPHIQFFEFFVVTIFIVILILGFIYEWFGGVLTWPSTQ